MARRANPSIAPTSRRPRMHIFGIHNPALQRLHPLLNYLLNPLRMRFIRWQRAHIIAPIRRAVKTRDQVSRHPWPRPVRTPRIFRRQAPPRPILHLVINQGRVKESFLFICEKKHVLFPHVEMKGAAIFKIARFRKWNVPSEFNPPLCPSFLPLIPLEEARYSSRYCPQAQTAPPQAAPRADRAPMQSRARFASDTWEDHRIQTHPPVSKLGRRCQRSSRARSSSCRSSPDRLGSEQCSLFFLPIV